jgi:FkbM family methyltransferase
MALGTYESEELRFILNTLAPGDGFIDVGAHVGYFSLPAARKVGESGRVIAIEPTPSSAAILRENVALNSFSVVTVIEAAASCRSGTGQLTTSRTSSMWNTLERETLPDATESVEVSVRTIDEIVAGCGSPSVRLLKLDVEGHERDVLLGAVATIKRNSRLEILFEVSGGNLERERHSRLTLDHLASLGFGFRSVEGAAGEKLLVDRLSERMRMPRWQDHLFNVLATRQ